MYIRVLGKKKKKPKSTDQGRAQLDLKKENHWNSIDLNKKTKLYGKSLDSTGMETDNLFFLVF